MQLETTLMEVINLQEKFNNDTNGVNWRSGITKNGKLIDWRLALIQESAEMIDSINWKHWKNIHKETDVNNFKIELVDNLHFLISHLLTQYNKDDVSIILHTAYNLFSDGIHFSNTDERDKELIRLCKSFVRNLLEEEVISEKNGNKPLTKELKIAHQTISDIFFQTCHTLGFKWEEIYKLYISKNCLNTFRQKNGYKDGTYIKNWGKDKVEDNVVITELLDKELLSFDKLYEKLDIIYKEMNK